jgi:hypothetical protein
MPKVFSNLESRIGTSYMLWNTAWFFFRYVWLSWHSFLLWKSCESFLLFTSPRGKLILEYRLKSKIYQFKKYCSKIPINQIAVRLDPSASSSDGQQTQEQTASTLDWSASIHTPFPSVPGATEYPQCVPQAYWWV